jgi:ribonuclease BN (tRNA processing enzyme)
MEPVRVDILGSGNAFSDGGRNHSAYLIKSPRGSLLLDCGPTTLASMKRLNLSTEPINQVLLSHLHGDHTAGLPFFFLEYIHIEPRNRPLVIAGPHGAEENVRSLYRAMYPDSCDDPLPYHLVFFEAMPGYPLWFGDVEILPFHTPHQKQPISLGFVLRVDGRKIVYTGDSGWTEDFVKYAEGADLFICECSFFETRLPTHLDYPQIMENLSRIKAKRILLTHLGQEVLNRRSEIELELASDGQTIIL